MTAIDLARLPPPDVVEPLDFDTIFADLVAAVRREMPDLDLRDSDPAAKILQAAAYRELALRARVNAAARQSMVAFATGANLDHLAALFGVVRKTLVLGDPDARPPRPPVIEDDEALRGRVVLALEGMTTAGPRAAYVSHALAVDGVASAAVASPAPGEVVVHVLPGEGVAVEPLLDAVARAVNADHVRPLTDQVRVAAARRVGYQVEARLTLLAGPDPAVVSAAARAAVAAYAASRADLGRVVARSGLIGALHCDGVESVDLIAPAADLHPATDEAPVLDGLRVEVGR
ncbi:phage-related baseplate assembly protein [Rhodothalassium salexigens DSM 2132]|uniref:Phage-related baseplate assembly protein n=1 Tax=Rhodothalassium salexigens DSM 2132 TaxID=1188247 RepID=A0A4R2P892_RHOSA|nr:baseplate J/gp47 family protein [Rhodothalassium salexigens]MBB4212763.1 phage-related baseplate assembly protein [Rhodothalassium salexigens DSM 2132]MBK1638966.1 hypothetical protein [Rhodothalassium salexigens DSM 2132]TCP30045.1 phage-related baseplate assembly protein [Rhodothalassium salexigens DSM 2132]